jgi:two-component system chemotaxis response regulator CheB
MAASLDPVSGRRVKNGRRIKVLIVDDSAVIRQVGTEVLARAPDIEVVGAASDPLFALERMKTVWPDVIVLDVEMPRMDGISFLRKIMIEHPTPVVMCSSLTAKGARTTMDALEAGAVAIITKPRLGVKSFIEHSADELIRAVREAAAANVHRLKAAAALAAAAPPKLSADAMLPAQLHALATTTRKVIAIGTSTGGTQALEVLLKAIPRAAPGMVIVQHMPPSFTASFAARLNSVCELEVREAASGDRVMPGRALIAPGGKHMLLARSGAEYHVDVVDGPLVSRHKPSVDVLFRSVANVAGANAIGAIMTGMGDDGARGLLEMKQSGAYTFAQDENSCVVFGMPREAIARGAVDEVVPLSGLSRKLLVRACHNS